MSESPTPLGQGWDELNKVTQSGIEKMVRVGDRKLIYDTMGYGQLYHLASDPCDLTNLFGQPSSAQEQARLMEGLLMWPFAPKTVCQLVRRAVIIRPNGRANTTGTPLTGTAARRTPLSHKNHRSH